MKEILLFALHCNALVLLGLVLSFLHLLVFVWLITAFPAPLTDEFTRDCHRQQRALSGSGSSSGSSSGSLAPYPSLDFFVCVQEVSLGNLIKNIVFMFFSHFAPLYIYKVCTRMSVAQEAMVSNWQLGTLYAVDMVISNLISGLSFALTPELHWISNLPILLFFVLITFIFFLHNKRANSFNLKRSNVNKSKPATALIISRDGKIVSPRMRTLRVCVALFIGFAAVVFSTVVILPIGYHFQRSNAQLLSILYNVIIAPFIFFLMEAALHKLLMNLYEGDIYIFELYHQNDSSSEQQRTSMDVPFTWYPIFIMFLLASSTCLLLLNSNISTDMTQRMIISSVSTAVNVCLAILWTKAHGKEKLIEKLRSIRRGTDFFDRVGKIAPLRSSLRGEKKEGRTSGIATEKDEKVNAEKEKEKQSVTLDSIKSALVLWRYIAVTAVISAYFAVGLVMPIESFSKYVLGHLVENPCYSRIDLSAILHMDLRKMCERMAISVLLAIPMTYFLETLDVSILAIWKKDKRRILECVIALSVLGGDFLLPSFLVAYVQGSALQISADSSCPFA